MPGSVAARWASWEKLGGPFSALTIPAAVPTPVGVPILEQQFPNQSLRLVLEFAFGANLTAAPGSWVWSDVTSDVQVDGGKNIQAQIGRIDARTVAGPAQLSFTLDNRMNLYSRSALSPNWPNIKRGVPIRLRVSGVTDAIVFQGRASSFTPGFDSTGAYAVVAVVANGIFRRLGVGNQPLQSTMRIYTPSVSNLVAYWPMEDESSATSFAAVSPSGALVLPMTAVGPVQFHSDSSVVSSDALPVFSSSSAVASVPAYPATGAVQFRVLVVWPASTSALPDQTIVARLYTTGGSISQWDITYGTGGSLKVTGYSATDHSVAYAGGAVSFNVDGTAGQLNLSLTTSGSDITIQLSTYQVGSGAAGGVTDTATGQSLGVLTQIQLMPFGVSSTIAMGHVTVQTQASDIFENAQPVNAYDNEFASSRVNRLLGLVGVSNGAVYGDGIHNVTRMGPQRIDTLLNLIRECEATDAAIVIDGLGDATVFDSRLSMENVNAAQTWDATQHLMPPLAPVDDDQQLRNQWTVQQHSGSSAVYTDTSSPNSVSNVGLYSDSVTVNVYANQNGSLAGMFGSRYIQNLASWLVNRDTPDGYRLPSLTVAFHRAPSLLARFVRFSSLSGVFRLDVSNLSQVYPQMPLGTQKFLVTGWTHTIDKFTWTTTVNVSPYDPYLVGVIATPSGDTSANLMRLDTVGSSLAAEAAPGASTLLVSSLDKGLWTTNSDSFPFTIKVGGIAVTVTGISGASSPQTFTVDPATVLKTLPVGSDVRLWSPPVLSMGGSS